MTTTTLPLIIYGAFFLVLIAYMIYRFRKGPIPQPKKADVLTMPTPEAGAVACRFAGMTEADQEMLGDVIFRSVLRAGIVLAVIGVAIAFALQALTH